MDMHLVIAISVITLEENLSKSTLQGSKNLIVKGHRYAMVRSSPLVQS